MFEFIYTLFKKKLEIFRKYLTKNKNKEFIKKISITSKILDSLYI